MDNQFEATVRSALSGGVEAQRLLEVIVESGHDAPGMAIRLFRTSADEAVRHMCATVILSTARRGSLPPNVWEECLELAGSFAPSAASTLLFSSLASAAARTTEEAACLVLCSRAAAAGRAGRPDLSVTMLVTIAEEIERHFAASKSAQTLSLKYTLRANAPALLVVNRKELTRALGAGDAPAAARAVACLGRWCMAFEVPFSDMGAGGNAGVEELAGLLVSCLGAATAPLPLQGSPDGVGELLEATADLLEALAVQGRSQGEPWPEGIIALLATASAAAASQVLDSIGGDHPRCVAVLRCAACVATVSKAWTRRGAPPALELLGVLLRGSALWRRGGAWSSSDGALVRSSVVCLEVWKRLDHPSPTFGQHPVIASGQVFRRLVSAMLELQAAGLIPEQVVTETDLASAKRSFVRTFSKAASEGSPGSYLSWIGCGRVQGGVSACDGADGLAHRLPVDIG